MHCVPVLKLCSLSWSNAAPPAAAAVHATLMRDTLHPHAAGGPRLHCALGQLRCPPAVAPFACAQAVLLWPLNAAPLEASAVHATLMRDALHPHAAGGPKLHCP